VGRQQHLHRVAGVESAAGAEVLVEQHAGKGHGAFRAGEAVQIVLPAACRVVAG